MHRMIILLVVILLLLSCHNDTVTGPESLSLIGKWILNRVMVKQGGTETVMVSPDISGSITFEEKEYQLYTSVDFESRCETKSGAGSYSFVGKTVTFIPN